MANADPYLLRLMSTMVGHQDVVDNLMERRVAYLRRLEAMQEYQKFCAKQGDREGAKFFKEEVADARKYYLAACLLIPHVAAYYPGDCKLRDLGDFPLELMPAASHIIGVVTL